MQGMKKALLVTGVIGSVFAGAANAAPIIVDVSNVSPGANTPLTAMLANGSGTVTYNQYSAFGTLSENLTDIDGNVTPFDFQSVVTGSTSNNSGSILGDVAAIFPSVSALNLWYTDNATGRVVLSGLDSTKTYDFEIYSSRSTAGGVANTGFTLTGTNSVAGVINSRQNTSNLLVLGGVQPTNTGTITLTWYKGAGTSVNFAYFNAFRFTEVVPEPASMGLLGVAAMLLGRRVRKA